MKSAFARYFRGAAFNTEEFQAEASEWKTTVSAARNILRVRSRLNLCDFMEGPLQLSMECALLEKFPVPPVNAEKFARSVSNILFDVRHVAEEEFMAAALKSCKRGGGDIASYDWDRLKTNLDHKLKEIAPCVAQLYLAARTPTAHQSLLPHYK